MTLLNQARMTNCTDVSPSKRYCMRIKTFMMLKVIQGHIQYEPFPAQYIPASFIHGPNIVSAYQDSTGEKGERCQGRECLKLLWICKEAFKRMKHGQGSSTHFFHDPLQARYT